MAARPCYLSKPRVSIKEMGPMAIRNVMMIAVRQARAGGVRGAGPEDLARDTKGTRISSGRRGRMTHRLIRIVLRFALAASVAAAAAAAAPVAPPACRSGGAAPTGGLTPRRRAGGI